MIMDYVSEMCLEESLFMSLSVGSIRSKNMLRNRDNKRPAHLCQGNAYSVKFSRSFNYSPEKKKINVLKRKCLFKDLTCRCVHYVDICRK